MVTTKQFDICTQEKNVYSGKQTDEPLTAQTDTDSQTDRQTDRQRDRRGCDVAFDFVHLSPHLA